MQERETKGEGKERKSCNFAGSTHDCSCFVSRVGKILQSECCIRRFSVKSSILSSTYAHRLFNISHVATLALCLGLGGATDHIWKYQTKSRTPSGDPHAGHSRQSGCLYWRPETFCPGLTASLALRKRGSRLPISRSALGWRMEGMLPLRDSCPTSGDTNPIIHIPQNTQDKNQVFCSEFRPSTQALVSSYSSVGLDFGSGGSLSVSSSFIGHASVLPNSASTSSTVGRLALSASGRVPAKA